MDLISASNILNGSRNIQYLEFLRSNLNSHLTDKQIAIASAIGFSHVTYEQWQLNTNDSKLDNYKYFILLVKTVIRSLMRRIEYLFL